MLSQAEVRRMMDEMFPNGPIQTVDAQRTIDVDGVRRTIIVQGP